VKLQFLFWLLFSSNFADTFASKKFYEKVQVKSLNLRERESGSLTLKSKTGEYKTTITMKPVHMLKPLVKLFSEEIAFFGTDIYGEEFSKLFSGKLEHDAQNLRFISNLRVSLNNKLIQIDPSAYTFLFHPKKLEMKETSSGMLLLIEGGGDNPSSYDAYFDFQSSESVTVRIGNGIFGTENEDFSVQRQFSTKPPKE
jgi:hypothetical protein